MAALAELFGETLVGSKGDVPTAEALKGKEAVALYFSAHWCPPCRGFTPEFAKWYTNDLQAKGLEVVFVSSDRDEASFKEYFHEMPWLALPYNARDRNSALNKKFKVKGIPTVVILDGDGKVITLDGREAVGSDPTGQEFPWKQKGVTEILDGATLVGKGGATFGLEKLKDKVVGLYFSAHWCPPCRGFTPKLAEWYEKDLKDKGLEVVFISSDRDHGAFEEYFAEQPWLALEFSDRKRKDLLSRAFKVSGIPSLIILDKDFSVITKDGRAALSGDPTGKSFPWHPRPVSDLAAGPGDIQEIPSLVAFCECCDPAVTTGVEDAISAVAQKYADEAKASGEDPSFAFFIAKEPSGLPARLRQLLKMESLPPAKHEHPLAKKEGDGWGCDGCGQQGLPGADRFGCTAGCDFDFCADCNAKAGQSHSAPPVLVLLDLPDGAHYEGPPGEITPAAVQKYLDDYVAKKLERKALQP